MTHGQGSHWLQIHRSKSLIAAPANGQRLLRCCLQEDAKKLAQSLAALEEQRTKWAAEVAAREAALAKREQEAATTARQRNTETQRRMAQEEQVGALLKLQSG